MTDHYPLDDAPIRIEIEQLQQAHSMKWLVRRVYAVGPATEEWFWEHEHAALGELIERWKTDGYRRLPTAGRPNLVVFTRSEEEPK